MSIQSATHSTTRDGIVFKVSDIARAKDILELLSELGSEDIAHTWSGLEGLCQNNPLAGIRRYEEQKRPTKLFTYLNDTGSLLGIGTVAERLSHEFRFNGFPVVARCAVRRLHRGQGLYTSMLQHRVSFCRKKWGRDLNAIHLGTASPQVRQVLRTFTFEGRRFVPVGKEALNCWGRTESVTTYLWFSETYAQRIATCLAPALLGTRLRELPTLGAPQGLARLAWDLKMSFKYIPAPLTPLLALGGILDSMGATNLRRSIEPLCKKTGR